MVYKAFVDSDIIIDFLSEREDFYKDATYIFSLAYQQQIQLFTSALIYTNVFYLLRKDFKASIVKQQLQQLTNIISLADTTAHATQNALSSDFSDFEDAVQYYTAIENKCAFLITRNIKDYKKAKNIRVLSSSQFCKLFV